MTDHPLPSTLRVNAWVNGSPAGESAPDPQVRASGKLASPIEAGPAPMRPGAEEDPWDWADDRVGWGLVLAENPQVDEADRGTPVDAADAIQALWEIRGKGPVLRYDPTSPLLAGAVSRYAPDGARVNVGVGSPRCNGPGALPRFLLIAAPPDVIPWSVQFAVGHSAHVGRLDPTGDGAAAYVNAVAGDWQGATAQAGQAVVWSAVRGDDGGITELMRDSVASAVYAKLVADDDIGTNGAHFVDGSTSSATHQVLRDRLAASNPALVITTSHGSTGPLDQIDQLRADLGLLIDNDGVLLDVSALLGAWKPGGAIWYSHACCSAGVSAHNAFEGLVKPGGDLDALFSSLPAAGEMIAPFPRALLTSSRPARAFIGHVEPTFDWTLRNKKTGAILTASLESALYTRLYQPHPVGYALDEVRRQATQLHALHDIAKSRFARGNDSTGDLLALKLMARDLESLVLLGDPAVSLPAL